MTAADARKLALSFAEATEQDHHGFPSFRIGGKIFATLPSDEVLRVMAPPETIAEAVEAEPDSCFEVFWGKNLSAVGVMLERAKPDQVETLLHAAWSVRAPARLRDAD